MRKFIIPLALCAFAVPALAGPDFNPPSWRGLPNSTTQGWDFIFGFTHSGDLSDDRVVTMRNPNELPTNIVPGITTPASPNIVYVSRQRPNVSDTFITLLGTAPDVDYSRLLLGIPNFQSDSGSLMRIQVTYRIAELPWINVLHMNGLTEQRDITTNLFAFSDRIDPDRGNWRQATYDFEFGHTSQWHAVLLTNTSGLELDIESIVIDTIVPAPGTAAVVGALSLVALRRRRQR